MKIIQALELSARFIARWASPKNVTPAGGPPALRVCTQPFFPGGFPAQFSQAAAPVLALLNSWRLTGGLDFELRELPKPGCKVGNAWRKLRRQGGLSSPIQDFSKRGSFSCCTKHEDPAAQDEADVDATREPWGWAIVLRTTFSLLIVRPRGTMGGGTQLRVCWQADGPFARIDLLQSNTLRFVSKDHSNTSNTSERSIDLALESLEAAVIAFSLASTNLLDP